MHPFMMSGSPDYMQWMKDSTADMVDEVIDQVDVDPNDKEEAKSITGTSVSVISAGAVNRITDLKEEFFSQRATLLEDIENSVCLKKFEDIQMITQNEEWEGGEEADERKKYMMWATGDIHECLMKRKKCEHLSESQSHHIMQEMTEFPEDTKLIKTTYKLSISSNQNLIRKVKHRDVGMNK